MKYRRCGKVLAALLLCISTALSAVAPAYALDAPAGLRTAGEPSEETVREADRLTGEPLTAEAEGTEAVSPGVSTPAQNEIIAYYAEHGIDLDAPLEYASGRKPDISAYSDAGALSESCLNKALDVLNFIRYVAGIPSDVKLDDTYTHYAQAAAFVNHANKTLSHEPKTAGSKPAGMPEQLWEDGATGASRSNIAWGSWNGYSLPDQIMGYMDDGDEYNIDCVGHRRWILNPTMSRTGFGAVDGGGRGTYGALYAFDRNGSSDCKGVVWPARNMPIELFDASHPWSISMGQSLNASGISVTLTRTSDQKSWSFGSSASDGDFYVNNDYFGLLGCIIFRPPGLGSIRATDSFRVEVKDGGEELISYDVAFFSLDAPVVETPILEASVKRVDLEIAVTADGYDPEDHKTTITVTNSGNADAAGYAVSLVSGADCFTLGGSISGTIAAGAEKSFYVCPAEGLAEKSYEGKLRISAEGTEAIEIPLTMVLSKINTEDRIEYDAEQSYTGEELTPALTIYRNGAKLISGTDYMLSYRNNLNTYVLRPEDEGFQADLAPSVTISYMGEYSGSETVYFVIRPRDIGLAKAAPIVTDYNGEAQKPEPVITDGERLLKNNEDYVLSSYRLNGSVYPADETTGFTEAGSYTLIYSGKGNYSGSIELLYTIRAQEEPVGDPVPITKVTIGRIAAKTYTGAAVTADDLVLTYDGKELKEGTDYTVVYSDNIKAGTAKAVVTGINGFSGTKKLSFKIQKKEIEESMVETFEAECVYLKGGAKPAVTLSYNGLILQEGTDFKLAYKNNKKVYTDASFAEGKAPLVKISGKGNFSGSVSLNYTITKKAADQLSFRGKDKVYGSRKGGYLSTFAIYDRNGKKLSAGTDYDKKSIAYLDENGVEIDKKAVIDRPAVITVRVSCTGNYEGVVTGSYRLIEKGYDIGKARFTIRKLDRTYTGTPVTLSEEDFEKAVINGSVELIYGKDYVIDASSYKNNSRKGTASVDVIGIGSYGGRKTVKFRIKAG